MKLSSVFLKLNGLLLASTLLIAVPAYAATTASFSISGSGSYTTGSSFTVVISENSSSQEVNSVEADVHYDASLLQVTSVSVGDFTTCPAAPSASGGTITISCAALGSKFTGTHTVGSVHFKSLADGTAGVNILSSSAIVDANTNQNDWNQVQTAATYTFTTPAPTPTPTPTPAPAPTTGAGSSTKTSTSTKTTSSASSSTPTTSSTSGDVLGASNKPSKTPASQTQPSHKTTPKAHRASATLTYSVLIGLLAVIAITWAWIMRARQPLATTAGTTKAAASKKKPAQRSKK